MTGVTSPTGVAALGSTNDQKIEGFEGDLPNANAFTPPARKTNDITAKELRLQADLAAWTRAYGRSPGTTTTRRAGQGRVRTSRGVLPRTRAKRRVPRGRGGQALAAEVTPEAANEAVQKALCRPTGERGEAEGHRGPNPRLRAARQTRAGRGLAFAETKGQLTKLFEGVRAGFRLIGVLGVPNGEPCAARPGRTRRQSRARAAERAAEGRAGVAAVQERSGPPRRRPRPVRGSDRLPGPYIPGRSRPAACPSTSTSSRCSTASARTKITVIAEIRNAFREVRMGRAGQPPLPLPEYRSGVHLQIEVKENRAAPRVFGRLEGDHEGS